MRCKILLARKIHFHTAAFLFAAALVVSSGCGSTTAINAEVSGIVTIDGKPYENVKVSFYPQDSDLDASFVATGTTDASGNFTLEMSGERSGCPCTSCKVIITEPPVPDKIRADLENGDGDPAAYKKYMRSLKLRPIPSRYTRLKSTPLLIEVEQGSPPIELELTRR